MKEPRETRSSLDRLVTRRIKFYRAGMNVPFPRERGTLLVSEGTVRMTMIAPDGRERDVLTLAPGDLFETPYSLAANEEGASLLAFAISDCAVAGLSAEDIKDLIAHDPSLIASFLRKSAENTSRLLTELERIAFSDSVALIAAVVAEHGHASADLSISQERLAQISGKSRVTVGNALHRLKEWGIIEIQRSRIHIRDRQLLLMVARGEPPPPDADHV